MLGKRDGSGLLRRTRNCQRGSGARTLEGHASALEKIINHPKLRASGPDRGRLFG